MNKLLTSVLGLLTVTATGQPIQSAEKAPRLVVGIHIDQLNANYLEWFKSGFGDDGFKKLIKSGTQITNMVYASEKPDGATAAASFMTGATPREHGIVGRKWYDPTTGKQLSCVFDPNYLGNYTQETVSPKNLLASTLGDQLKQASNEDARVFAVGIDADQTILLGGHNANGVYWLDSESGKWCTSTYFNYMPSWLQTMNDNGEMDKKVGETTWSPLKTLSYYQNMPHQQGPSLFQYAFNKPTNSKFAQFKASPLVNAEVVRLADEILAREQMGKDAVTDYLIVQLSAANFMENKVISAMEIQDVYYRLDEEIAKLIATAEKSAGKDVEIYVTGNGQAKAAPIERTKYNAYLGDFYPDRCTSLLNLYLMAIYGNEPWVSTWSNQKIYLNRTKIEEKGLDIADIRRKSAAFLTEFSGVTQVFTYDQLLLGTIIPELKQKANALQPDHAADLYLEIQGGWNVLETAPADQYQVDNANFSTPFILYKPEQKAQTINTPIGVGDVTATLSRIFRIRPPNACKGVAILDIE